MHIYFLLYEVSLSLTGPPGSVWTLNLCDGVTIPDCMSDAPVCRPTSQLTEPGTINYPHR
jgi:hypothetical protein